MRFVIVHVLVCIHYPLAFGIREWVGVVPSVVLRHKGGRTTWQLFLVARSWIFSIASACFHAWGDHIPGGVLSWIYTMSQKRFCQHNWNCATLVLLAELLFCYMVHFGIRKNDQGMSKLFSEGVTVQIILIFLFFLSLKEPITEFISTLKSRWMWIRASELSLVSVSW